MLSPDFFQKKDPTVVAAVGSRQSNKSTLKCLRFLNRDKRKCVRFSVQ
jgi:hypothetical protein